MDYELKQKLPIIATITALVLAIFALFLPYFNMAGMGISGIDFATKSGDIKELLEAFSEANKGLDFYLYVPIISLILGIVAVIMAMLPMFGVKMDSKVLYGIILAIGVIMLVIMLVYSFRGIEFEGPFFNGGQPEWIKMTLGGSGGIGVVFDFIASIFVTLVGVFGLTKIYEE